MSFGHALLVLFIVGVPALAIVPLLIRLRQRRHYAFFRVIDDATKAPLAGAEVVQITMTNPAPTVSGEGAGARVLMHGGHAGERRVGQLDARGELRRVFGQSSGALLVKGPGIKSGIIGLESVSEFGRFPAEPYECRLVRGTVLQPTKASPIARGLAPGEVANAREGYVSLYEKPETRESYICWPTLAEAKANDMSGGMTKFWRVTGSEVAGHGVGGASFMLDVETVQRAKE